jgi:hypothetical protein
MMIYFLFHSLHARVHGNWVAPAYPVVAVLGAQAAFQRCKFPMRVQGTVALSRRLAVPIGLTLASIAYLQAAAAPIPIDPAKDPLASIAGWACLADQLDAVAKDRSAKYILTSHYALTSEFSIYSRGAIPIIQYNERIRWLSFGSPQPSLFAGHGLYVAQADRDSSAELAPLAGAMAQHVWRDAAELVEPHRGGFADAQGVRYITSRRGWSREPWRPSFAASKSRSTSGGSR